MTGLARLSAGRWQWLGLASGLIVSGVLRAAKRACSAFSSPGYRPYMGELDPDIREELERRGPAAVREALQRTAVGGFVEFQGPFLRPIREALWESAVQPMPTLKIRRSSVEEWLREKEIEAERGARDILKWAKIAGWFGILTFIATIAGIVVPLWLSGH